MFEKTGCLLKTIALLPLTVVVNVDFLAGKPSIPVSPAYPVSELLVAFVTLVITEFEVECANAITVSEPTFSIVQFGLALL